MPRNAVLRNSFARFLAAFTLIELLVVIAIIAILVALLLPAVQSVREAARRSQCQDHLHNLGLAIHNYEGVTKRMPIGAMKSDTAGYVWVRYLLPYIEQKPLSDQWNESIDYHAGTNLPLIRTDIAIYQCPSDTWTKTWNSTSNYNYAACMGQTSITEQASWDGVNWLPGPFRRTTSNTGWAYAFRDMVDGTSNVMLLGEVRQGQIGSDLRGLTWFGKHTGFTAHYPPNTSSPDNLAAGFCNNAGNAPLGLPCQAEATTTAPTNFSARSRHPGGVHVCMGDAKVTFVSENIDLGIWRALSTMAGGEVAQVP
ncbi:MAG: DUF1559 domain-containing protein [Planctomycetaceae bacterium]